LIIGFATGGMGTFENTVRWASKNGFGALEVAAAPGAVLEPAKVEANASSYKRFLKENGVIISALDYGDNFLDPDAKARREKNDHLRKVVDACVKMELKTIVSLPGRFPGNLDQNYAEYEEVFGPTADYADAHGVRLAFEIWPGLNFASTPPTWERLFKVLPSKALGLNFDPSHLVWQFIDYVEAARGSGDRIYHVHAKDTEIIQSRLAHGGTAGSGWWRYRMPGWGVVNWPAFVSALKDIGYDYALSIEHEDPLFSLEEGLLLGRGFLARLLGK